MSPGHDSAGGTDPFDAQGRKDSANPAPPTPPIFPPGTRLRYWDDARAKWSANGLAPDRRARRVGAVGLGP